MEWFLGGKLAANYLKFLIKNCSSDYPWACRRVIIEHLSTPVHFAVCWFLGALKYEIKLIIVNPYIFCSR